MPKSLKEASKRKSTKAESTNSGPPGPASKGRLLALEGAGGRELEEGAERLVGYCGGAAAGAACSRWDASSTFFELRLGNLKRYCPPVRTLLLLYASDLLFRLRWEIRPALAEGRTLVVAPYVETAVGFGLAAGVAADWLEELFSFAPKPDLSFRVKEKAKQKDKDKGNGGRLKSASGFVEFSSAVLAAGSTRWNPAELRAGVLKHFEDLEEQDRIRRLGKKAPKDLASK